jgi:large subunit ribosomal protein L24
MKLSIKKGDNVIVITGEDKGKTGVVTKILVEKQKAIVEGINIQSKHTKPNAQNPQGAIVKQEGAVHISNLAIVSDGKPSRVGRKSENGKSVRYAKATGKNID